MRTGFQLTRWLSAVLLLVFVNVQAWAVPSEGTHMMISGPSPYAVETAKKVAEQGGNVIDVAVAVGLTLSVTSPYYAALGGGGFALVKMSDQVEVLDFRETAPGKTSPQFYLDKAEDASRNGGTAVGVPGFPAGLYALHQKYGKLKWEKLFQQSLLLARRGFRVSGEWVDKTSQNQKRFQVGEKHFLDKKGKLLKPGEVLKQPGLYNALKRFQSKNVKGFYEGAVAKDIVQAVQKSGGVFELSDLKNYKVRWLKPLTTDFNGYKVYMMPPPSSGGVVILSALELIEKMNLTKYKPLSVDELHLMSEILSRSFRGRALLGDPDFHKNPIDHLTSDEYLTKMAKSISLKKTNKLEPLTTFGSKESKETTHYSVMDSKGNAIALTVTLNGSYGSGVVSDKYGIALNNEMDDFTARPGEPNMYGLVQGKGNLVEPGKRPLSSMSPTLVEKDGRIVMSLGAPGGPRIISGVLQTLYRVLGNQWDVDKAIQAPRVHHQFLPHKVFVDANRLSPEILEALRKRGHVVEEGWQAKVYAVRFNEENFLEAAFDLRGEGAAGGF